MKFKIRLELVSIIILFIGLIGLAIHNSILGTFVLIGPFLTFILIVRWFRKTNFTKDFKLDNSSKFVSTFDKYLDFFLKRILLKFWYAIYTLSVIAFLPIFFNSYNKLIEVNKVTERLYQLPRFNSIIERIPNNNLKIEKVDESIFRIKILSSTKNTQKILLYDFKKDSIY